MPNSKGKQNHFQYARRMIFLGVVFVPLVPYMLALGVVCTFFINSLGNGSHSAMTRIVQNQALVVETFLDECRNDLDFILNTFPREELAQQEKLESILAILKKETGAFVDLGLLSAEGKQLAYVGPYNLEGKNYGDSEWFNSAMRVGAYVSDVFLGYRGVPHFVVTQKSQGPNPVMLRATIDSDAFSKVVESVRVGKTGEAFLLNKDGLFQTKPDMTSELLDKDPDFGNYPLATEKVRSHVGTSNSGKRYLYAITNLNQGRWTLVARQELGDAFNDIYQAGWYVLAVSILGGIVTVSLASFVSRKIGNELMEADEVKGHLRERLFRSARLAELGEMTASFAHEINNPLQVMRSELTLMDMFIKDAKEAREKGTDFEPVAKDLKDSLDQLQLQIDRCSSVTRSILSFGRQDKTDNDEVYLGRLMPDIAAMVKKKAEVQNIEFNVVVNHATPMVRADAGKLQQIFLNLLNNAIYAVVERHHHKGGRLDFTAASHGTNWVQIKVSDNGTGIPKEILAKIYTPFFTTKPPKKGTGLGLAVCYGLVESMGGSIEVVSQENVGTEFTILLPAHV